MQIEIIKISGPVSKGKWSQLEVAYKTNGKVEGKKFFSFKHEDVYKVLCNAKEGEAYDVVTTKEPGSDGKEYWQWTGIVASALRSFTEETDVKTDGMAAGGSVPAGVTGSGTRTATRETSPVGTGRVTGSNYETAVERAARQRLIVRQSSITAALTFMTHNAPKQVLDIDAVLSIANRFENHVFGEDNSKNPKNVMSTLENDLPE